MSGAGGACTDTPAPRLICESDTLPPNGVTMRHAVREYPVQHAVYTRSAFRQLAGLAPAARARVEDVARALAAPQDGAARLIRPLPGGGALGLAQAAVEGVGHMVCRIDGDRIAILDIVARPAMAAACPDVAGTASDADITYAAGRAA